MALRVALVRENEETGAVDTLFAFDLAGELVVELDRLARPAGLRRRPMVEPGDAVAAVQAVEARVQALSKRVP